MIRILIADDHPIVREGLKRIVADCADMRVVGEASDGPQVVELCRSHDADVLLLDLSMPGPGFLETMKLIRAMRSRLRVLVLSVHSEEQYAIRCLRAGAAGYLTKDHSPERLEEAIRRVYAGRKYLTTTVAEQLAAELDSAGSRTHHPFSTDRQYRCRT